MDGILQYLSFSDWHISKPLAQKMMEGSNESDTVDEAIDKMCKVATGNNETTASSYAKDFKKTLMGEEHTGNIPAASINKARVVEDIEKSQEVKIGRAHV